jgi:hypothetical protein
MGINYNTGFGEYKSFVAILELDGALTTVTPHIFKNTIGNIVFSLNVGQVDATLVGAFPVNKTWINVSCTDDVDNFQNIGINFSQPNTFSLIGWYGNSDPVLSNILMGGLLIFIEIRVYP